MKLTATQAWLAGLGWLATYEAYALATQRETLSEVIWSCEGVSPIVPFGLGFLCGHFCFQTIRNGRPA